MFLREVDTETAAQKHSRYYIFERNSTWWEDYSGHVYQRNTYSIISMSFDKHLQIIIYQAEEEEDPVCAYPAMTDACKKECTAPFALYEVIMKS